MGVEPLAAIFARDAIVWAEVIDYLTFSHIVLIQ